MGPKKKRKDEPPPEMGEGSKISALPQFVARHLEVKDERTGALRIWFASNNLKVCVCVSVCVIRPEYSKLLYYSSSSVMTYYAELVVKSISRLL